MDYRKIHVFRLGIKIALCRRLSPGKSAVSVSRKSSSRRHYWNNFIIFIDIVVRNDDILIDVARVKRRYIRITGRALHHKRTIKPLIFALSSSRLEMEIVFNSAQTYIYGIVFTFNCRYVCRCMHSSLITRRAKNFCALSFVRAFCVVLKVNYRYGRRHRAPSAK